ncbi:Lon protease-like protein [Caulobacter ginsengisoli]|uniref:Lon protease-like protein n=1 Tax=Caulobacter ginsengisoli TaxID=400775 RepID=A0ABU0ITL8_9CAUL|nr:LON peptidase substrate-binding domain-containing protein [Caulobacter ginsengisoli]MDQ0465335.1 Lon protease-like protein [Caulobacter ginsengisoli]
MPTGYRKATDLPQVIPVFPLDGALLLPGGQLPLNIFEPRYLNMIDDAMASDRVIGMVQTREGGDRLRPHLAPVGCLGKITAFAETGDGRYMITLTGVCRFTVGDELPVQTPYRQVRANYAPYDGDLRPQDGETLADRQPFLTALKHYLDHRGLEIDWESAQAAPPDALINSLAMALPFEAAEKQVLLEAASLTERRDVLITLLEFDAAGGDDDDRPRLQ